MLLEPFNVAAFGVLLDLPEKLHRLRLIARFGRICIRNNGLDVDGDDVPVGSDQPCATNSLAGDLHKLLAQKVYRDQLRDVQQNHVGPNGLYFSAVG